MRSAVFLFFFFVLTVYRSYAQCETLAFAELGYEPAHCRIAGYQSGNGVVYASAMGGTPDYTYQWTNIQTGMVTANTTLGGVNPGDYTIKVTDDIGCVITAIIKVDSVIPVANFEMLSAETVAGTGGISWVEVNILNSSEHINQYDSMWDLEPDTNSRVSIDNGPWEMITWSEIITATFNTIGHHEICLATMNHNQCTDTICKSIEITEPLETAPGLNITTSSVSGEFVVELLLGYDVQLTLYDLSGVEVLSQPVVPGYNTFNILPGQYIYEIADPVTNSVIASGTFFVL